MTDPAIRPMFVYLWNACHYPPQGFNRVRYNIFEAKVTPTQSDR